MNFDIMVINSPIYLKSMLSYICDKNPLIKQNKKYHTLEQSLFQDKESVA